MGFYLWLDGDSAWAQGTYEYRAMGAAVIARTDLFRRGDFAATRRPGPGPAAEFAGQFASLGHVNQQLEKRRKSARRAR
ncbi:MAG: hypothetical protein JST11_28100 [Acidobacteria bacterium]|nr:hypothetical protein [Acidobacteriota bacterium]